MDRVVKKRVPVWKIGLGVGVLLGLLGLVWWSVGSLRGASFPVVDLSAVQLGAVRLAQFEATLPVKGRVVVSKAVAIAPEVGGYVATVLAEEGDHVSSGQALVRLENTTLEMDILFRQAQLNDQINNLENSKWDLEKEQMDLEEHLLGLGAELEQQRRNCARDALLAEKELLAGADLKDGQANLDYLTSKYTLLSRKRDRLNKTGKERLNKLTASIEEMKTNLALLRGQMEKLVLRAPVSGRLVGWRPERGQPLEPGAVIGRIEPPGDFMVEAEVDDYYLDRLRPGQPARAQFAGTEASMVVEKISSEVVDGRFLLRLNFEQDVPEGLFSGQTATLSLVLDEAEQTLVLPRGAFFNNSGGAWAFVLATGEPYAVKRDIRLGRQNQSYYEVLSGLVAGDQVVISRYGAWEHAEKLRIRRLEVGH